MDDARLWSAMSCDMLSQMIGGAEKVVIQKKDEFALGCADSHISRRASASMLR
jgi:hypothetical protein